MDHLDLFGLDLHNNIPPVFDIQTCKSLGFGPVPFARAGAMVDYRYYIPSRPKIKGQFAVPGKIAPPTSKLRPDFAPPPFLPYAVTTAAGSQLSVKSTSFGEPPFPGRRGLCRRLHGNLIPIRSASPFRLFQSVNLPDRFSPTLPSFFAGRGSRRSFPPLFSFLL